MENTNENETETKASFCLYIFLNCLNKYLNYLFINLLGDRSS